MKQVIVRLKEYRSTATPAEKSLINYMIMASEELITVSIQDLAKNAYSSTSTIMRLCRKIGFAGFKEFKNALIYEMALQEKINQDHEKEIMHEDNLASIVRKVTYKNCLSLSDTAKLVDVDTLKACVDLIDGCKSLSFFGLGSSLLVARDAYLKFLRVNKPCYVADDWHAQLLRARNLGRRDVALIISYSGMTEEMILCAKTARERQAKVIAITGFEKSKLVIKADYCLYVAAIELVFRSGAMSSRIAQLNMVDILYTAYINRNYEECLAQFEKTHLKGAAIHKEM